MNNNATISTMYDLIRKVAAFWRENIHPTPFMATFHAYGVRVDIKVSAEEQEGEGTG